MKDRVLYLDTTNRKLLWRELLERALAMEEPVQRKLRWWEVALAYLDAVFWP